jgi:hypothetical protein
MEPVSTLTTVGTTLAIANKLLGKTAEAISDDLANLYKAGLDKIVSVAIRKTPDIEDGKSANLRVTRDVFFNGSFTDEAICAEYFGGILASSRSIDGKDDIGVFYTDIIKSLSSSQLKLHYIIYHSLNKLWVEMPEEKIRPNAGMGTETGQYNIWFSTIELQNIGIDVEKDLIALHCKELIGLNYEALGHKLEDGKEVPYTKVGPTTLGIQLYAVAHNKLPVWRNLPIEDFGEFHDIKTPKFFAFSIDDLLNKGKLK